MRHCRPSKQRVWLGSGRHLCGGGRRRYTNTNANADCYSDSDRHANGQPYCHSIGNGNAHAATDANTQSGAISKAASHASAAAIDLPEPRVFFVIGDR